MQMALASSAVALKQSQEYQLRVPLSWLLWSLMQLQQKSFALKQRAEHEL